MNVTVKDEVFIAAPPEAVWDYTQDWTHRTEWDDSVLEAKVQADDPRVVRVRATGGVTSTVRYKLYDRPHRTSLGMDELSSRWITGGGGSWEYVAYDGGTEFRQTNTIAIRGGLLGWLLGPVVRWQLRRVTRRMLEKAKAILEKGTPAPSAA